MRAQALLTLAVLLVAVGSFSIQGQWEYQGATDSSGQAVTLEIQDYIFRGQQILQKMIFRGCQQMLLQSQFNENQVFINPSSYLTEPIATRSC